VCVWQPPPQLQHLLLPLLQAYSVSQQLELQQLLLVDCLEEEEPQAALPLAVHLLSHSELPNPRRLPHRDRLERLPRFSEVELLQHHRPEADSSRPQPSLPEEDYLEEQEPRRDLLLPQELQRNQLLSSEPLPRTQLRLADCSARQLLQRVERGRTIQEEKQPRRNPRSEDSRSVLPLNLRALARQPQLLPLPPRLDYLELPLPPRRNQLKRRNLCLEQHQLRVRLRPQPLLLSDCLAQNPQLLRVSKVLHCYVLMR